MFVRINKFNWNAYGQILIANVIDFNGWGLTHHIASHTPPTCGQRGNNCLLPTIHKVLLFPGRERPFLLKLKNAPVIIIILLFNTNQRKYNETNFYFRKNKNRFIYFLFFIFFEKVNWFNLKVKFHVWSVKNFQKCIITQLIKFSNVLNILVLPQHAVSIIVTTQLLSKFL